MGTGRKGELARHAVPAAVRPGCMAAVSDRQDRGMRDRPERASVSTAPCSSTAIPDSRASGGAANPPHQIVRSDGTSAPSSRSSLSGSMARARTPPTASTPSLRSVSRTYSPPRSLNQPPTSPEVTRRTLRSGRLSASSATVSRPVSPPPTTVTADPSRCAARIGPKRTCRVDVAESVGVLAPRDRRALGGAAGGEHDPVERDGADAVGAGHGRPTRIRVE